MAAPGFEPMRVTGDGVTYLRLVGQIAGLGFWPPPGCSGAPSWEGWTAIACGFAGHLAECRLPVLQLLTDALESACRLHRALSLDVERPARRARVALERNGRDLLWRDGLDAARDAGLERRWCSRPSRVLSRASPSWRGGW